MVYGHMVEKKTFRSENSDKHIHFDNLLHLQPKQTTRSKLKGFLYE